MDTHESSHDKTLSSVALLAWEAALIVRGTYGPEIANSALERSARQFLRHMRQAKNPHLARLGRDAAAAHSFIRAIPHADGRTAEVVSIG